MRNLIGKVAAAALLGKPVTWISYAVQRGILSYYRIGSQIRFDPAELDEWCKRQRVPAADEYAVPSEDPNQAASADGNPDRPLGTKAVGP